MKKSNKAFIILSAVFLGLALIAFVFELYTNYACLKIVHDANQADKHTVEEAVGTDIGVGFMYVFTIMAGIASTVITIPVIPFSIVMLRREKNAPYAITFLVAAGILILLAIGTMFILPLSQGGSSAASSSSYISSSY